MNTNSNNNSPDGIASVQFDIRQISESQLARLGVSQLAYVRPVQVDGEAAFAIHAADGTPMAVTMTREMAQAAIMQHDMLPALVH